MYLFLIYQETDTFTVNNFSTFVFTVFFLNFINHIVHIFFIFLRFFIWSFINNDNKKKKKHITYTNCFVFYIYISKLFINIKIKMFLFSSFHEKIVANQIQKQTEIYFDEVKITLLKLISIILTIDMPNRMILNYFQAPLNHFHWLHLRMRRRV